MKRILIYSMSLLVFTACGSSTNNEGNKGGLPANLVNNPNSANGLDTVAAARKPTMDFKDTVHNFGAMHKDEVGQYEFEFTNYFINILPVFIFIFWSLDSSQIRQI